MTTINLLPWRTFERKRAKQLFIAAICGAVLLAFILNGIWYSALQAKIDHQNERNALLQSEVQLATQSSADKKAFEKEKTTVLNQVMVLQELNNQRFRLIELLQTLPNLLPNNVLIDAIHVKTSVIELIGDAKMDSQVSDFVKRLKQQPRWHQVQLQELSQATSPSNTFRFQITLSLE